MSALPHTGEAVEEKFPKFIICIAFPRAGLQSLQNGGGRCHIRVIM